MLNELIASLIRSRRVSLAIVGNGMVSLASLGLAVSIARSTSVTGFGWFSIAMVSYLFASGFIRAALTDSALSRPADPGIYLRSLQRASLLAIVGALLLAVWAICSGNIFLGVLAAALHGLLILDFIRTFDSAVGSARRAFAATTIWSSLSLVASLASFLFAVAPELLFGIWAGAGALSGYALMYLVRAPVLPGWTRNREETNVAAIFAADYLVGTGGSLLTTGLLGFIDNTRVLAAIRGGGTLLGPLNLISTTARSLMLPFLARTKDDPSRQLHAATSATAVQLLLLAPLFVALQFLPDAWGERALGETWDFTRLILLPMSLEAVFALVSGIASSGHRVAFAGTRSFLLRLATGVPRPFIVLTCAHYWGALGAAWSMAIVSVVNAAAWWASYYNLLRRPVAKPSS